MYQYACQVPADRIGDREVMSGREVVIGRAPEQHDSRKTKTIAND
jgi:hypothetical protein